MRVKLCSFALYMVKPSKRRWWFCVFGLRYVTVQRQGSNQQTAHSANVCKITIRFLLNLVTAAFLVTVGFDRRGF
jgi:hypothetical protein